LGEEGGGYMMGNDCLIALAREADGRGPKTVLTRMVMEKLELSKPEDLIAWRYADQSFARPASVTPLLFAAAGQGDSVALEILAKSVNGLAESIESVWRNLGFGQEEPVPIVFAGGNLTHEDSILCSELKKKLMQRIPTAEITLPVVDPAMAAALLALNNQ
jgi:N-acetylglucosamine kinase-like BadF-type ATPase